MDEWIKKKWYLHAIEYYSTSKRKEILSRAISWMNLKDIMLSEISQSQRENRCIISFI